MFLKSLKIHNYKSLRDIELQPSTLSCLVGPNASGKSNFADSLDFLSEVYNLGLEVAIARKGGYENIAFRKMRRSKAAIRFDVTIETPSIESKYFHPKVKKLKDTSFRFNHNFSFIAKDTGIRAEFGVLDENFSIASKLPGKKSFRRELDLVRKQNKSPRIKLATKSNVPEIFKIMPEISRLFSDKRLFVGERDLFITGAPHLLPMVNIFSLQLANFQVFRFSPQLSRTPGVPIPNPRLSTTGENLPAIVDWLQRKQPRLWKIVIAGMQEIVPGLERIFTQYLHTKVLGLFFQEVGAGRPWIAEDVSDGTIQALAMLVASVDPRCSLLVIEEPENSVHPWILRITVDRLREVSAQKTVFLTTHSPILIDRLRPDELLIVSREKGETKIIPLVQYDSSIKREWEAGKYRLSEFLDAGLVPSAVPGGIE